jgi:hypothetical protein
VALRSRRRPLASLVLVPVFAEPDICHCLLQKAAVCALNLLWLPGTTI